MPILQISDAPVPTLVQQCAECSNTFAVPIEGLVLGVVQDTIPDPHLIALPACTCGAQEFLNQTFDEAPDHLAEHRKKVNALSIALKAKGQIHPELAERIKADTRVPSQVGKLIGSVRVQAGLPAPKLAEGLKLAAQLHVKPATDHAVEVLKRVQKEPRKKASTDNPKRTEFMKAQSAIITAIAAVRRKPLAPDAFAPPKKVIPSAAVPAAFEAMPDTAAPVVSVEAEPVVEAPSKGGGKKGKNA